MRAIRRPQFLTDVEETADYLHSEADEALVLRWREALKRTVALLREFPELGRLRSDLPMDGIRTFPVKGFGNWLVFYRVGKDHVEFLRVKHGMMHLPGLFESEHPPA